MRFGEPICAAGASKATRAGEDYEAGWHWTLTTSPIARFFSAKMFHLDSCGGGAYFIYIYMYTHTHIYIYICMLIHIDAQVAVHV